MKQYNIYAWALVLLLPASAWGHSSALHNSYGFISLDSIDIQSALDCDQSTVACQMQLETTRALVQALLIQVLEAQSLAHVSQVGEIIEEQVGQNTEASTNTEYFAELREVPLREGRKKSFDIDNGRARSLDQDSHAVYQETWKIVSTITPERLLNKFEEISFINDPDEYFAAQVYQQIESRNGRSSEGWEIEINLDDVRFDDDEEYKQSLETIAHEVGHVLSLNESQLDFFVEPDECERFYVADMESCADRESYFERFAAYWDSHEKWFEQYAGEFDDDQDSAEELLRDYFDEHQDEFVSEYAATSFHEDLAETMAVFATTAVPTGELSMRDEKVLALYEFDEMIEFRKQVQGLLRK